MGSGTFRGGIHPYDGKELSRDRAIQDIRPGKELAYLVSQHIGAPAKPIVKKGDRVLVGQMIAEAGGFVSAPVYASVSGVVKGIEKRLTATGGYCDAIIVENDEVYESVAFEETKDITQLSKDEICGKIQKAGIVGMGGAGFPTNVKLSPKEPDKIDYVIVNGAECEPYLTSDYRRLIEEPEVVIVGLKVMLKLFDNAKGIIAVEDNKLDAIAKLKELVKSEDRIEIKTLYTKYPQGAERMLINAVTGRKINSSMLPADAGCVVDNVDTVFAIKSAVIDGRPLIKRVITVTGDAINEPHNFLVRTGTNHSELIDAAGGFKEEPEKIISGGPMMGMAISTIDVPVTKTSSALLCYVKDPLSKVKETNCINCGRCVSVCPGRIIPTRLAEFSEHGDMENFVKYNGLECCECGCCSYICPAKRNLTQAIKSMRKQVLASKKK